jgi:hypothetical protein
MVPSLYLGDSVARSADAWVMDHFPPDIGGAISQPLLFESVLVLDGKASTATFVASEIAQKEVERRYPGAHWSTIPLIRREKDVCVDLEVAGHTLRLLVDTGSAATSIDREAIDALGLKAIRKESIRDMDASGDRVHETEVFRVEGLKFGGWTCDFETPSVPPSDLRGTGVAGLLGFDFMRRVPCVFDLPNGRMMVRDAEAGVDAHLHSTMDGFATACFEDPLREIREMAVVSTARVGRRRSSPRRRIAGRSGTGVCNSAAAAIESFAKKDWPAESRAALAKSGGTNTRTARYHLAPDASRPPRRYFCASRFRIRSTSSFRSAPIRPHRVEVERPSRRRFAGGPALDDHAPGGVQ